MALTLFIQMLGNYTVDVDGQATWPWDPDRQDAQRWLYLHIPRKQTPFWKSKHTPAGYGADELAWVGVLGFARRNDLLVLALDSTPSISTPAPKGQLLEQLIELDYSAARL